MIMTELKRFLDSVSIENFISNSYSYKFYKNNSLKHNSISLLHLTEEDDVDIIPALQVSKNYGGICFEIKIINKTKNIILDTNSNPLLSLYDAKQMAEGLAEYYNKNYLL